jgi:dTDP-4-dehydrorhamnose 3,5-epimerase
VIPPGVYHGYKTIGNEPSLLLNMTNNYWDKGVDEHRAPYNDSNIPFDWIKVLHK